MLFGGASKQHPYLVEYLDEAVRQRPKNPHDFPLALGGLGFAAGGIAWAVASLFGSAPAPWQVFGSAVGMWWVGMGCYVLWKRTKDPPTREETAQQRLRETAYRIAKRMHASKEKRRLHRDLSASVAGLLEECARNWSRAHIALESTFWTNPELPLHWTSLRDQSMLAVDQAMNEVLVILETAIPDEPGKWRFDEVVEEVIGKRVFNESPRDDSMPLTYAPARELAEKLKMLAAEVERATQDVAKDASIASQFSSGSALDLCVGELRNIQAAETELRQNIGRTESS